jgi:hypothetical protein
MYADNLISKFKLFPFYVFTIVLFFLTHGYSENAGLIPLADMFLFFLVAGIIALAFLYFFKKKLGTFIKSGIITGLIFVFYLFYAAFQDTFKGIIFLQELSRYRVLLPLMVAFIILIYFMLKRSSKKFQNITLYLNVLLIVLILVDIVSISTQLLNSKKPDKVISEATANKLWKCDTCNKPDIYLIVMDEYWGNNSLKNFFNYDNTAFTDFLRQEGFFVASKPSSNYASTPLSMAATFDMEFIPWLGGRKNVVAEDYAMSAKAITNSITVKYLQSLGYSIKNFSIFDIADQPSKFKLGVLPIQLRLITTKTLAGTMEKDLSWHLRVSVAPRMRWVADYFKKEFEEGNDFAMAQIVKEAKTTEGPKFVYAHLMMPHAPYLFDSLGKENDNVFSPDISQQQNDRDYLNYLVYTNNRIKELVQNIQASSKGKAVIVVMSDHGLREHEKNTKIVSENNNFNAVFIPGKKYGLFYDSISNINQFRVLFNTIFNQRMPLLKDSCAL